MNDEPLTIEQAKDLIDFSTDMIEQLQDSIGKQECIRIRAQKVLLGKIAAGETVEGFEAVEHKGGKREWIDADEAVKVLVERITKARGGSAEGLIYELMRLRSPAEVEKIIPKSVIEDLVKRGTTILRKIQ